MVRPERQTAQQQRRTEEHHGDVFHGRQI
jgi:hypothetical protein